MSATCSEGGFMGVATGGSPTGALSALPYELRGVRVIRFCDRAISSTALGEGTRIKAVSVGEWTIVIPRGISPDQEGPVMTRSRTSLLPAVAKTSAQASMSCTERPAGRWRITGSLERSSQAAETRNVPRTRACVRERTSLKEHVILYARRLFDIEPRHIREDERIGVEVGIDPRLEGFVVCPCGAHVGRKRECEKDDKEPLHLLYGNASSHNVHAETVPLPTPCGVCAAFASGTLPRWAAFVPLL